MKEIFQERLPYTTVLLLDGNCYVWGDAFISNIITAMSTDNLTGMTAEERRTWYTYVDWTNHDTHSADLLLEPDAVGCTVPDGSGNSYAVLQDGTITTTLCNDPLYDIPKADLYKSLDTVLMNILNCLPYNQCGADEGDLVDVSECPLT
ncbi:MAG: hypothetical protein GQ570_08370 [Helicobacteraceae bacterium]|nr:hypothetical protein [Helicobacteraceae bacterium]